MGRRRGKGKGKGRRKEKNGGKDDRDAPDGDPREKQPSYDDIEKKNEMFETYYKHQKLVAEDEWSTFMDTLKDNLPAAFRISEQCFNQAKMLKNIVHNTKFDKEFSEDDGKPFPISCLKWYPNELAFQMKLSRVEIRRSEALQNLHSFLMSESESGYICRQEAVSMLPPLLLDVQHGHKVLDACAAPGSKTAQIIEMLHAAGKRESTGSDSGVVVANDVDNKRCYMLVHQSKRLHSPAFVIVNHDAGSIPNFHHSVNGQKARLRFDRVLCDVPCAGDGTVRKNYDVWLKWSVANGNNFHGIQARIAKRCLQLLSKDGLMVYSTCSMNPVEDEAVVCSLLNQSNGGLELVDVSCKLKELKYIKGLENWVVMQRDMKVVKSVDEVDERFRTQIRESMFPPTNIKDLNISRCIRILPHLQDTGGFFVAVLKKTVDYLPWESSLDKEVTENSPNGETLSTAGPPSKKRKYRGFREDPFFFFNGNEPEWIDIKRFYKISDDFPVAQLMYRSTTGKKRNIYFLTAAAKSIIENSCDSIKFINSGVRLFSRIDDKVCACGYRITQEGLSSIYPFIHPDCIVNINKGELGQILSNDHVLNEQLGQDTQKKLSELPSGCCIFLHKQMVTCDGVEEEMLTPFCGWKGKTTTRAYILKSEKIHILRICGLETSCLEEEERKRFADRLLKKQERAKAGETKDD